MGALILYLCDPFQDQVIFAVIVYSLRADPVMFQAEIDFQPMLFGQPAARVPKEDMMLLCDLLGAVIF